MENTSGGQQRTIGFFPKLEEEFAWQLPLSTYGHGRYQTEL